MNYVIYDLEFNQKYIDFPEENPSSSSRLPFEIIQIGALKLNERFETLSSFNALIKPEVYPNIHPYVEKLTRINNNTVSSSKDFVSVYKEFLEFIGDDQVILCVWGTVDIKELLRNIEFYNLSSSSISKYYIDVQKTASLYLKSPNNSKVGLKTAIELLNLKSDNEFHDAFNDAYYTSEIFKTIYDNTNIKPSIYSPNTSRKSKEPKEKIDTVSLIKQFEKMYNREMSSEEKTIIKLAYNMGRTRQFVVYTSPIQNT
ncbi:exonuclease domain-containing protein [Clostridium sp. YIM B02505]|uniref:Exonuclease domain-containing protein n=1 Tax=Clostridium yunnanense TaxID=2800325 RepID=A0ABS1EQ75_9CLOT|nr:3'-5' exonuclease [Clostridium yunnanense]MBK1811511.1 exonuclease domain-containing protein [Clostridium yunnanense]